MELQKALERVAHELVLRVELERLLVGAACVVEPAQRVQRVGATRVALGPLRLLPDRRVGVAERVRVPLLAAERGRAVGEELRRRAVVRVRVDGQGEEVDGLVEVAQLVCEETSWTCTLGERPMPRDWATLQAC